MQPSAAPPAMAYIRLSSLEWVLSGAINKQYYASRVSPGAEMSLHFRPA